MRVNIGGQEPLTGRARVPARCEGVLEANSLFSPLIREGSGLREPRIARTRSFPALDPAAAGPLPKGVHALNRSQPNGNQEHQSVSEPKFFAKQLSGATSNFYLLTSMQNHFETVVEPGYNPIDAAEVKNLGSVASEEEFVRQSLLQSSQAAQD
jgi:hypothetical protein